MILLLLPLVALAAPPSSTLQTRSIQGSFSDVRERLESAIANQGFTLSNSLHLQEMLQRTAKDLGMPDNRYLHAEAVEFCSAKLAHLMSQADPRNLANCPFVITLYVLPSQPTQVQVVYRLPVLAGKKAAAVQQVIGDTLAAIVAELEF